MKPGSRSPRSERIERAEPSSLGSNPSPRVFCAVLTNEVSEGLEELVLPGTLELIEDYRLSILVEDRIVNHDTPVTFGVIGPGMSPAEAHERIEYGAEAVPIATELISELP